MQGNAGGPTQGWHTHGWDDDAAPPDHRDQKPCVEKSVNRFAIALALLPLASIPQMMWGLRGNLGVDLAIWGVIIALSFLDARELRRLGHDVTGWWGVLLPIIHLVHRTRRSGQTSLIPWLWVVSLVASIFAGLAILDPADFDVDDTDTYVVDTNPFAG